jgi:hypothetical protein
MSISLSTRNEQGSRFGERSEFQANSRKVSELQRSRIPVVGLQHLPVAKHLQEIKREGQRNGPSHARISGF